MFEPELEIGEPVIEMYVATDSDEENSAATELLQTLDVEQFAKYALQSVHVEQPVKLTLVVSGDTEIQALNRRYREQDKPTDVLSFPLLTEPLIKAPADWLWQVPEETFAKTLDEPLPAFVTPAGLSTNLGDIMISWPTTRRQAEEAGHSITYELLFLLCHGILHLVGYDDQTEAGYNEMVRLQKEILAGINQEG